MLPVIAIVGRPNVGKSTFFNKVAGRKIAITENRPGVTRDRITADCEWRGRPFTLIDTGGIELKSEDTMWKQIALQAQAAVEMADVILFFTDGREGLTSSDHDVADYLRRSRKPVVLVVNKIDDYSPDRLFEFYSLGLGEPVAVSSEHSRGIGDALDAAVASFPQGEERTDDSLKIAVVGKPNAGKSSLVNRLLGQERTIVTPIAGTTRDAVDTRFERDGQAYTIIDTAGIRRKRSVEDDVEYYSVLRAFDAVRRADVCLLVVDAQEGITEQDLKIVGYVHEQGKPSVIVMNKWDVIEKDTHTVQKFEATLKEELKFMDYFRSARSTTFSRTRCAFRSRRPISEGASNSITPRRSMSVRRSSCSSSTMKSCCTSRTHAISKTSSAARTIFRERPSASNFAIKKRTNDPHRSGERL